MNDDGFPYCSCGDLGCTQCDGGDDADPHDWCPQCGGDMDTTGRLCSECHKEDCMDCGMCEDCVQRAIDAAEEWEPRPRRNCEVCGRGLNAEDEAMNNGMCIPCSEE